MKRIVQKDRSGCGIACIAMVTGKSYKDVKNLALEKNYRKREHIKMVKASGGDEPMFTSTGDLINLAQEFEVTIECKRRKKFKLWEDLPDTAILAVNWKKKKNLWHWVVFKRLKSGKQYIVDPHTRCSKSRYTRLSKFKPVAGYLPIAA